MQNHPVQMLQDTLEIFEKGCYEKNGKIIYTKLSPQQREACCVYLPENVQDIVKKKEFRHALTTERVDVTCMNMDSFEMARAQSMDHGPNPQKKPSLVLNFANPVHPGGGVRRGARAQEEDLCRKSSLLFSLENGCAQAYYQYHQSRHTNMASDAMILTPEVEIIRDSKGELLDESVIVSVLTCAAPMISRGMEGLNEEEYRTLFYQRICAILRCAAYWGYKSLVLGAFGCGVFGNDAKLVSELFYKALVESGDDGLCAKDFFHRVDFAVLDKTAAQYNYRAFCENFLDFHRDKVHVCEQEK